LSPLGSYLRCSFGEYSSWEQTPLSFSKSFSGNTFNIASQQVSEDAMRYLLAWHVGKNAEDIEDYVIETFVQYSSGKNSNPLDRACVAGDSEAVAVMFENTKEELLGEYLLPAIYSNRQELVHFLLEYGVNNEDAFIEAVKAGKIALVEDVYLHSEITTNQIDEAIDYLANQPSCDINLLNFLWVIRYYNY